MRVAQNFGRILFLFFGSPFFRPIGLSLSDPFRDFFGFRPAEPPDMDFSAQRTYGLLIGSQRPFKLGLGTLSEERGVSQK